MKIVKFRIKNYKSIKDSGECYLSNEITVLAGKNESGKTSVLEALEDFNIDKNIREKAIPILDEENKPEITITFQIDFNDLNNIFEENECGLKINKKVEISIIKSYPDEYSIEELPESLDKLFEKYNGELIKKQKKINKKILRIEGISFNQERESVGNENVAEQYQMKDFISHIKPQIQQISNEETKKGALNLIEEIENIETEINNIMDLKENLADEIKQLIPNFILFEPYKTLPNKVPITELDSEEFISDLAKVSDFNIETIKSEDYRKKQKHKHDINIKFNKGYQEYWVQDETNVKVDWDSNHVFFWVEENNIPYEPEIRSKGKQWYLAFYIKLTARSNEEKNNIILIDEPGLYLHAKAQEDVLRKLGETSKKTPIIFSTHSPYLIDPNNLDRIRLVVKDDDNGTEIKKITAKADKDTLTPILTAIGENLTLGIRTDKKNSIVSEGFSDYIYLCAFKKILKNNEDINIVPSVGADTAVYVGSILFGWGLDPIFILDNDVKGKKVKNKLKSKLGIDEKRIIFILESTGEVEDILSKSDFKKFVLEDEELDYSNTNSEYVKDKNIEKILLGKKFKEKVETEEVKLENLDGESQGKIKLLFNKISELLSN